MFDTLFPNLTYGQSHIPRLNLVVFRADTSNHIEDGPGTPAIPKPASTLAALSGAVPLPMRHLE